MFRVLSSLFILSLALWGCDADLDDSLDGGSAGASGADALAGTGGSAAGGAAGEEPDEGVGGVDAGGAGAGNSVGGVEPDWGPGGGAGEEFDWGPGGGPGGEDWDWGPVGGSGGEDWDWGPGGAGGMEPDWGPGGAGGMEPDWGPGGAGGHAFLSCDEAGLESCFSNYDCSQGTVCEDISDGEGIACCVPGALGPGQAGDPCQRESDCETAVCIDNLCSNLCMNPGDCPEGMQDCRLIMFSESEDMWCFPEH